MKTPKQFSAIQFQRDIVALIPQLRAFAHGGAALIEILDGNRKIASSAQVRDSGGCEDILAQLSVLTPAGAHGAAYA